MIESTSRKLVKNFSSLVSVQIANYILPLIVLPYLTRTIGVEKFGTIAFAQAIVMYFTMLTNFGFNLYGPREVSISRAEKSKINKLFWNIVYAKAMLSLVSFVILIILVSSVSKFRSEYIIFIFSFGFVIGGLLFPVWFFQGIEKMTSIAIFNFFIKLIYAILIFILIKKTSDYIYAPLFYSLSEIFGGLISFIYVLVKFKIAIMLPNIKSIFSTLRESVILFFSNVCISVYTKIPPVLLGFLAGDLYVGYYAVAERIFYAILGIQSQLSTTFYPHISRMVVENSRSRTIQFIKKTLIITMFIAILLAFAVYVGSPLLINLVFGKSLNESVVVLRILCWLFIIVGLSNVFGIQTMLTFNMKREIIIPLSTAGIINVILGIILIPNIQHIGAALSFLVAELWVTIIMFLILKIKGFDTIPNFNFTREFIQDIFIRVQSYVSR